MAGREKRIGSQETDFLEAIFGAKEKKERGAEKTNTNKKQARRKEDRQRAQRKTLASLPPLLLTQQNQNHQQERNKRMSLGSSDRCLVCEKRVYILEKLTADGKVFHKTCFRCNHCQKVLSLGTYASLEGKLFCKPHFKQLFKLKGNYSEGFGKKKITTQWLEKKEGLASAEEVEEANRRAQEAEAKREQSRHSINDAQPQKSVEPKPRREPVAPVVVAAPLSPVAESPDDSPAVSHAHGFFFFSSLISLKTFITDPFSSSSSSLSWLVLLCRFSSWSQKRQRYLFFFSSSSFPPLFAHDSLLFLSTCAAVFEQGEVSHAVHVDRPIHRADNFSSRRGKKKKKKMTY